MDSPECFSGFGQVSRNILTQLHETGEYEITVFGINQPSAFDEWGNIRNSEYPFTLLDASFLSSNDIKAGMRYDMFGKQKLVNYMFANDFDIFFTIQDPAVVSFLPEVFQKLREHGKKFKTVIYFPIDADHTLKEWCETARQFDYPVVYTEYGYNILKKYYSEKEMEHFLPPIPHGVNPNHFHPLSRQQRKSLRSKNFDKDTFIVLNVNRNQPRKDPCRSLAVFAEFKKHVPDSVYIFHCNPFDIGNNLVNQCKYYGLEVNKDVFFPSGKSWDHTGFPIEWVNEQYNIADVLFSTSLGEGFGLSSIEAMATKLPVVLPNNTANIEIVGKQEERGLLADSGNSIDMWQVQQQVLNDPPRPITSIPSMVEKLLKVYEDKVNKSTKETEQRVHNAFEFACENTWENIFHKHWEPFFRKISN